LESINPYAVSVLNERVGSMVSHAVRVRADDNGGAHEARQPRSVVPDAAPAQTAKPPSPPLTVLLVVPTLETGAAAANVSDIAGVLSRAGHRAVVVARQGQQSPACRRDGGTWMPLDVASLNPAVMLANVPRLARIVREHGCDVVHAHGRAGAWSAYVAARMTGRPLITTWYKGFREQNVLKHIYNGVMARGDRIVAVSDQIAELIGERYASAAPRDREDTTCIDMARFNPAAVAPERVAAVRRDWGLHDDTRVLLVAGRFLRRKGHHVVVQAAQTLKALGLRDFVCVFASPDAGTSYAGELWDQVLTTGTADVVRLAGPLEDMPAGYAAATVVLSAAVQPEGIQRVILEAQAMARPVIASDLGASSDLVLASPAVSEDRATGLRFPAADPSALAGMVVRLLSMPEGEQTAMGARGRAWVTRNFDPDAIATQTLALYAEAVGAGRG
jgi:glycosyltransferase involved in cell wall biosynthesis